MHLLIPYAASHAPGCQAALADLKLPNLHKLLSRLSAQLVDVGDERSLSPPHERALATALGLAAADGQIPWAARQAHADPSLAILDGAWAFVTLCHWQASQQQVTMHQIPMADLSQAESDTFLGAIQPFFAEDCITLYPSEPGRWLAHSAAFEGLATASPDRVLGRSLTAWMPEASQASGLLRLISEMQMLLYTHPLNDLRQARGALPVNAIWFSGSGALTQRPDTSHPTSVTDVHAPQPATPVVLGTLREAALREDWTAWAGAWQTLDATVMADLLAAQESGEPVQLTLCGERHAQTWVAQPLGLMQKIKAKFIPQPLSNLLSSL